jgi:hypothetical protein
MATVNLSPILNACPSFLASGLPNAYGMVNTYQAGTSTPAVTYTDSAGSIANSNPIPLTVAGQIPSELWLIQGQAYKFVIKDAALNILATYDNIIGVNDIGNSTGSIGNSIVPTSNNVYNLGQAGLKWNTIYATNIYGTYWNGSFVQNGSASISGTLSVAGGITLGNVSAPGTLAWYQEGTFTPSMLFGGAAVGMVYYSQGGWYTRIGNTVRFNIVIGLANLGSSTGIVSIAGLPFGSNPSCGLSYFQAYINGAAGTHGACVAVLSNSNNVLFLLDLFNNNLTNAAIPTTYGVTITGTYFV